MSNWFGLLKNVKPVFTHNVPTTTLVQQSLIFLNQFLEPTLYRNCCIYLYCHLIQLVFGDVNYLSNKYLRLTKVTDYAFKKNKSCKEIDGIISALNSSKEDIFRIIALFIFCYFEKNDFYYNHIPLGELNKQNFVFNKLQHFFIHLK